MSEVQDFIKVDQLIIAHIFQVQLPNKLLKVSTIGGVVRAPPPDGYLRNKKNLLAAPNPPFLLASTS